MIFGLLGTGYGAYAGAKTSPGRAATYALGLGFVGNLLDFAILAGVAAAVDAPLIAPTTTTPSIAGPLAGVTAFPNNPANYRIRRVRGGR